MTLVNNLISLSENNQRMEVFTEKIQGKLTPSLIQVIVTPGHTHTHAVCQLCPATTGPVCQRALVITPYPGVWLS